MHLEMEADLTGSHVPNEEGGKNGKRQGGCLLWPVGVMRDGSRLRLLFDLWVSLLGPGMALPLRNALHL